MRRIVFVLMMAALLWCCAAGATTMTRTWNVAGPGGGGDFTSVTVSPAGDNVIVAGDVAGMWRRNGNSGNWTRIGRFDGLTEQTCVNTVAICPQHPTKVIAGTKSGIWYSEDSGQTWHALSTDQTGDNAVTAVTWGDPAPCADSMVVACAYNESGQAKMITATWSSSGEPSFGAESNIAPADDATHKYSPIKIVFDPASTGSSRDFYVLFGMANNVPTNGTVDNIRRELYRRIGGGSNEVVSSGTYIIDVAMGKQQGRGDFYVTTATRDGADHNSAGYVF